MSEFESDVTLTSFPATTEKKKIGRPSSYTEEKGLAICAEVASGVPIRAICAQKGMPDRHTMYRWMYDFETFRIRYLASRTQGIQGLFDELLEIADDIPEVDSMVAVKRAQLRVETRKWVVAKMAPHLYGNKVTVDGEGTITILNALQISDVRV